MKKLIVFNEKPEEIPQGIISIGGDVFETTEEIPPGARLAVEADIIGLPIYIARKNKIEALRDKAISAGVEIKGNTYDSSPESSQKISGIIALAGSNTSFKANWITVDNQIVELSLAQLKKIGMAIVMLTTEQYMLARQAKDAITADILSEFND